MLVSTENRDETKFRIRINPFDPISSPKTVRTETKFDNNDSQENHSKKKIVSSSQIHALILKKSQKKFKRLNGFSKETKENVGDYPETSTKNKLCDQINHDLVQSTSSNCILTGSCPELSQLDQNFLFYGDEFEFDVNPTLSKALSNSLGEDGINSKRLIDLDKQIVNELKLDEKFKNWNSSNKMSMEEVIDQHDSMQYEKLVRNHLIAAKSRPNPGKGVKSLKEEIEENEYFKKCLVVNATKNGPQTEMWNTDCESDSRKKLVDFKLPRTTYIESDLDTDMQIVVNCYDENTRRRDLRHRTKVCCSLM